jgi:hypothetical protein
MATTLEAMSEKLKALVSASQFTASIGTKFRMSWGTEESVELELIDATPFPKGARKGSPREPFSLTFRAATTQFYLPQGTYRLDHAEHGELHLFLVPLGPDDVGMRFEAVFS